MHQQLTSGGDATNPPPDELLQAWRGPLVNSGPSQRPHGRYGPNSNNVAPDPMMASIVPLFLALLQNVTGTGSTLAQMAQLSTPPAIESDIRSSPPPAVDSELSACLDAFHKAKGLLEEDINDALEALQKEFYTSDLLGSPDVTIVRLIQLTHFAEGHVIALKKFSCEWCGKVDAKHAHYH